MIVFLDVQTCSSGRNTKVRWSSEKHIINFVRQLNFKSEVTHSYTLQQNNPSYYGIYLTDWWDYTHPGSKSLGSTLVAKQGYQVELECQCWNTSYRNAPLKDQTHEKGIYVFSVMNKFTGDGCGM